MFLIPFTPMWLCVYSESFRKEFAIPKNTAARGRRKYVCVEPLASYLCLYATRASDSICDSWREKRAWASAAWKNAHTCWADDSKFIQSPGRGQKSLPGSLSNRASARRQDDRASGWVTEKESMAHLCAGRLGMDSCSRSTQAKCICCRCVDAPSEP